MKFLTVIAICLISLPSVAQIEVQESEKPARVGHFKNGATIGAELTYRINDGDTLYTLLFNDLEYKYLTEYKSISFDGTGGVVNQLYDVMKTFFSDENKKNKDYKKNLRLGDTNITLMNMKVMGVTSIMFHAKGGYFYLTEKQLNKLFGK
jgi:hypothetical protein